MNLLLQSVIEARKVFVLRWEEKFWPDNPKEINLRQFRKKTLAERLRSCKNYFLPKNKSRNAKQAFTTLQLY